MALRAGDALAGGLKAFFGGVGAWRGWTLIVSLATRLHCYFRGERPMLLSTYDFLRSLSVFIFLGADHAESRGALEARSSTVGGCNQEAER